MKIIPLLIVLIAVVLVAGRIMNNACKSSDHTWCAPMSTERHHITAPHTSWVEVTFRHFPLPWSSVMPKRIWAAACGYPPSVKCQQGGADVEALSGFLVIVSPTAMV